MLTDCSLGLRAREKKSSRSPDEFLSPNQLIDLLSNIRNMQIMKDRKRIGNQASKIAFKYFFSQLCQGRETHNRGRPPQEQTEELLFSNDFK